MEKFTGHNTQDMFNYCVRNNVESWYVQQYAALNQAIIRNNSEYPEELGACELPEIINTLLCGLSEDYETLAEEYGGPEYERPCRIVRSDGSELATTPRKTGKPAPRKTHKPYTCGQWDGVKILPPAPREIITAW